MEILVADFCNKMYDIKLIAEIISLCKYCFIIHRFKMYSMIKGKFCVESDFLTLLKKYFIKNILQCEISIFIL